MTETVVVIDFETTGLSPANGERATEVAAVKLQGERIVDTFQSLMNPGVPVPLFIQQLTGITDGMLREAPSNRRVIAHLRAFLGDSFVVAHNARFDERFLLAEYDLAGIVHRPDFLCTMKLAHRIYPNAPSYKLSMLLDYADIPYRGRHHRALADATATTHLWIQMLRVIKEGHNLGKVSVSQMQAIEVMPLKSVAVRIGRWNRCDNT